MIPRYLTKFGIHFLLFALLITSQFVQAQDNLRFALGSCNKSDLPQPLWEHVLSAEPDVWIWLGDIIYADTQNMKRMKRNYDLQFNHPEYKKLRTNMEVIGIWDDHDYGKNDAGKEYPKKKESRELLYDFLEIPKDHPDRDKEGAYLSRTFGEGDKTVKVILLDTRYFRDRLNFVQGRGYLPINEGSMLGEEQWQWLENELKENDAAVTFIGSGIQILHNEHKYEKWSNLPHELNKLKSLILKYQEANIILLSGDRHISEFAKERLPGLKYPLFEVTTSGLTHSYSNNPGEPNRKRIGKLITDLSFALVDIDWTDEKVTVVMKHIGKKGEVLEKVSTNFEIQK
ncbi:MAG: alkaline phosphatase family protein [Cyclobacteriaceae bacterium]|nr:alkaline phosphatase family protein [Cyclobacteriaceae bacterium]MCH8516606.1 alkaline phosphatase family protein [Cyclobacteriaceae bacterium]